jgi:hypothetical protein
MEYGSTVSDDWATTISQIYNPARDSLRGDLEDGEEQDGWYEADICSIGFSCLYNVRIIVYSAFTYEVDGKEQTNLTTSVFDGTKWNGLDCFEIGYNKYEGWHSPETTNVPESVFQKPTIEMVYNYSKDDANDELESHYFLVKKYAVKKVKRNLNHRPRPVPRGS